MRRSVATVALLVLTAGCAGVPFAPAAPTARETATFQETLTPGATIGSVGGNGYVDARAVESAPDGAVVLSANDSSIENVRPIQRAIREAYRARDGKGLVELTEREREQVRDSLPEAYRYDGSDGGHPGYYVGYRGEVFWVRVVAYA